MMSVINLTRCQRGLFQTSNFDLRKQILLKLPVEHRRFQERMPKGKKFGTVGAYFIQCDSKDRWCTLIHRRAQNIKFGGDLATPGGSVDKKDFSCYVCPLLKEA